MISKRPVANCYRESTIIERFPNTESIKEFVLGLQARSDKQKVASIVKYPVRVE